MFVSAPLLIFMSVIGIAGDVVAAVSGRISAIPVHAWEGVLMVGICLLAVNGVILIGVMIVLHKNWRDFIKLYGIICRKALIKFEHLLGLDSE